MDMDIEGSVGSPECTPKGILQEYFLLDHQGPGISTLEDPHFLVPWTSAGAIIWGYLFWRTSRGERTVGASFSSISIVLA